MQEFFMGGGVNLKGLVPMIYENWRGTLRYICISGIIINITVLLKLCTRNNSLSLLVRKLNELTKKPEYTITDNSSDGFDFSGCYYRELKPLWHTFQ